MRGTVNLKLGRKKNKVYLKIETEKGNGQRLYLKVAE